MLKKKDPLILKNATALQERGESALFNFSLDDEPSVIELPLEKLVAWPGQPRTYFSPEAMNQLVGSVKKSRGVQMPLLVRPKGNLFEVIAGERRFRAAQEAGLKNVPVLIRKLNDEEALEAALSENLDREDLNPIEELDALLKVLAVRLHLSVDEIANLLYDMKRDWEKFKKESGENVFPNPSSQSQQQVVIDTLKSYGKNWYSFTCSQLKLKNLPKEIYEAIAQGRIEYTKGLKFKSLKNEQQRQELLEEAIAKNWSIREIAERIKQLLAKESRSPSQPHQRITSLSELLKKSKLWEIEPKTWKKIENYFEKIENLAKQEISSTEKNQETL